MYNPPLEQRKPKQKPCAEECSKTGLAFYQPHLLTLRQQPGGDKESPEGGGGGCPPQPAEEEGIRDGAGEPSTGAGRREPGAAGREPGAGQARAGTAGGESLPSGRLSQRDRTGSPAEPAERRGTAADHLALQGLARRGPRLRSARGEAAAGPAGRPGRLGGRSVSACGQG